LQGLSKHILNNAEKLRKYFVDFDGKKELYLVRENFDVKNPDNDWATMFL
jgi:hypothetical protein